MAYSGSQASLVVQMIKNPPAMQERLDPWVRKIPWWREWYPHRYSCLENSMKRGAWWVTVHGVIVYYTSGTHFSNNRPCTFWSPSIIWPMPPPTLTLFWQPQICSVSIRSFCLFYFRFCKWEILWCLYFSIWLALLRIMASRLIYVVANVKISWLVFVCVCVTK